MDPNQWNTYNLQYAGSPGGLAPSHSSLNRLDIPSGLSLGHPLQATHGSLSGRSMSAIPAVNYGGLGVPLLDTMSPLASGMSGQPGHKAVSLGQSHLVFDHHVRGNPDQPSPNASRYDASSISSNPSKMLRSEPLSPHHMARNQILEAAAARVWASSNFQPSSLYNQFGSIMSEVPVHANPLVSSPPIGNRLTSQKSTESSLHNPPPAHSSSISRLSASQRTTHSSGPYIRSGENLVPSSAAQVSSLYSPTIDKDVLNSNQQASSVHRQVPAQIQHGYSSSHEDIEDLSSNAQNTLYGSYANLTGADAQDFSANHLTAEMSYEAVSPAPPLNSETAHPHAENSSFPVVHQFSDFVNMASQHPHNLSDKFQENEFRLKMDLRLQQMNQDALSYTQVSQERQDLSCQPKVSKDLASFVQSMQGNHRTAMMHNPNSVNPAMDLPHGGQTASININHPVPLLQHASIAASVALQQNQAKPPVQALADSTTKPKRRNRKKKDGNLSIPTSHTDIVKKSSLSPESLVSIQRPQIPQHASNILSMPPTSHISTHSHAPLSTPSSQIQQQHGYTISGSNQFSNRDSNRAHTPSMPQNYSSQENQGYTPAPSPKITSRVNPTVMGQLEFTMPSRVSNDKTGSYKQGHRKSKQTPATDTSINQTSRLYMSTITESPLNMQNYPGHDALMSQGSRKDSSMQDIHGSQHISRMPSFVPDQSQQPSITSQMPRFSQHSPQGSIPLDSPSYSHDKMNGTSHYMASNVINTDNLSLSNTHPPPQSPLEPSPVNVESPMSHVFDNTRNPAMMEQQDSSQFSMDFGGQPFLEQLVGAPIASTSFSHSPPENGDVVFTTLGAPSDSNALQHQQHQSHHGSGETYRPAYHDETMQDVRPVATLTSNMNMGDGSSFNTYFESQPELDPQAAAPQNQSNQLVSTPAEADPMTLTFVPQVIEDDDFSHFSEEPSVEVKKEHLSTRGKSDSFQESFLSYLQGNKQETLSSVSSAAITKRPQLPKYIPEPRRPKPPPPPPPPVSSVKESSSIVVSDDENFGSHNTKDSLSNAGDNNNESQKIKSDKGGYSVQRTSELAVKITLPKGKQKTTFSESALLSHNRKMKDSHTKVKKRRGKHKSSDGEDYLQDEIAVTHTPAPRKSSPPPARASIGRKAKDKLMDKSRKRKAYNDSGSSTEEELAVKLPSKKMFNKDESDQDYDSDKDPVWMPFEVDLKPGHDFDDKRKKGKKTRIRYPSFKSVKPSMVKVLPSISTNPVVIVQDKPVISVHSNKPESSTLSVPKDVTDESEKSKSALYKAGQYLIEKKDLQHYESYPVWRLEDGGSMIHKFELIIQDGVVKHKAVGTYSTWMKSMYSQFQPIKVKELSMKGREVILVQLLEEFRPKPPNDGKLILQYEDDPLVEQFNVYLQVFISQALEPSFLKTILDRSESFYVEALEAIDKTIGIKLEALAKQARWTVPFKEALHKLPLMKEIDRPNLKQACQACENSSPPTIKSVVLSGPAYDQVLLTEKPSAFSEAQEYMIGKTAAYYVRIYHTLHHFKYWLHQRCHSKVKLMKESSKSENLSNETILDRCLENRNWVLQLFDNLKKSLKFGGDVTR